MMRLAARLFAVFLLAACQMQAPKTAASGDQPTAIAPDAITVTTLDGAPASATKPANAAKPAVATSAVITPAVTTPAVMSPAIPVQVPGKTTPRPMPRPLAVAAPPAPQQSAAPVVAPPPVSPEQALCEKSRGQWSAMPSSSGHVCVHRTRDAGKSCHRKTSCEGECLATSGTCSPIMPLVGCNDILQADGRQVTLCLQ